MSRRCSKGGVCTPAFPATVENGWIIHYCKKCGTELERYPQRRKVLVADGVGWGAA